MYGEEPGAQDGQGEHERVGPGDGHGRVARSVEATPGTWAEGARREGVVPPGRWHDPTKRPAGPWGSAGPRATPRGLGLSEAAPGPTRISRRSVIVGTVIGLPVSALFLWLAVRGLSWSRVWDALAAADPGRVALAVVAMMAVYVVQAERWRVIARSSLPPLPRRAFLAMLVGGVAVSNVVPGRPGEILRGYWLGRAARAPFGRAFSTVVLDRAADVLALLVILVVSFPFVEHPAGWRTCSSPCWC